MLRKATIRDVDSICALVSSYAEKGMLLPRPPDDIRCHIANFFVYEKAGEVVAACHLKYGWDKMVEVRSLVVRADARRQGIATLMVRRCVEEATAAAMQKIFVLTYAVPLFARLGFAVVNKSALPLKIWEDCMGCRKRDNCDEVAMSRELHPAALPDEAPVSRHAAEAAPGIR